MNSCKFYVHRSYKILNPTENYQQSNFAGPCEATDFDPLWRRTWSAVCCAGGCGLSVFLGESFLTFQLDAQIDSFGYHVFEDMFLIVSTCC